jgi:putative FmdB family regulatory protein
MPIFEYRCQDCGATTGALVFAAEDLAALRCQACGGERLRRIPSRFAIHASESSRVAGLTTSQAANDSFYADPRNIGLSAKRRARDLGVDLGSEFDEVVERARTATDPEDLER